MIIIIYFQSQSLRWQADGELKRWQTISQLHNNNYSATLLGYMQRRHLENKAKFDIRMKMSFLWTMGGNGIYVKSKIKRYKDVF